MTLHLLADLFRVWALLSPRRSSQSSGLHVHSMRPADPAAFLLFCWTQEQHCCCLLPSVTLGGTYSVFPAPPPRAPDTRGTPKGWRVSWMERGDVYIPQGHSWVSVGS